MIFGKFKVSGHSMEPYLREDDEVIALGFLRIKEKNVVVFKYNSKIFIKRVEKIFDKKYFVTGDNKDDSLDSRKFGGIKKSDIMGRVVWKL